MNTPPPNTDPDELFAAREIARAAKEMPLPKATRLIGGFISLAGDAPAAAELRIAYVDLAGALERIDQITNEEAAQ